METLSIKDARQLALFAQGFLPPAGQVAGIEDVKNVLMRTGALQIDTINIVARAPYFSLWSRLGDYDPTWLNRLLEEKQIFEYWAHAACFLPIEDYGLHRRLAMEGQRQSWYPRWYEEHKSETDAVLEHIRQHGAVKSVDFKRQDGQRGTWWDWKIEKRALEYWFASGELMISKRVNFQRVYDLRERVLPDWRDEDAPDLMTVHQELVHRSMAAIGVFLPAWVPDYYRLPKNEVSRIVQGMIETRRLIELKVDDWGETAYALPGVWESYQAERQRISASLSATILSPFDSLIWDRTRTRRLFGFDFSIECYLPQEKRKYGYYLLPILLEGELIGRMDAKAHRKEGLFEIKGLFLEPGVKVNKQLAETLAKMVTACATWHKTPRVHLVHCEPETLSGSLQPFLSLWV